MVVVDKDPTRTSRGHIDQGLQYHRPAPPPNRDEEEKTAVTTFPTLPLTNSGHQHPSLHPSLPRTPKRLRACLRHRHSRPPPKCHHYPPGHRLHACPRRAFWPATADGRLWIVTTLLRLTLGRRRLRPLPAVKLLRRHYHHAILILIPSRSRLLALPSSHHHQNAVRSA